MVVNMLQHWSHKCSSQYNIIICVRFELIYYVINLDVVSSFLVFRKFDYEFLSMYC